MGAGGSLSLMSQRSCLKRSRLLLQRRPPQQRRLGRMLRTPTLCTSASLTLTMRTASAWPTASLSPSKFTLTIRARVHAMCHLAEVHAMYHLLEVIQVSRDAPKIRLHQCVARLLHCVRMYPSSARVVASGRIYRCYVLRFEFWRGE